MFIENIGKFTIHMLALLAGRCRGKKGQNLIPDAVAGQSSKLNSTEIL